MKTVKDISYSFNHTKERIKSRYGFDIDYGDYIEMCKRIVLKRNVIFISEDNQKKKQQIYDIPFECITIRVVWSLDTHWIKTALPYGG